MTAFRWSSCVGPSGRSVLRGKGHCGVNVTFYLLIFHIQGGREARKGSKASLKKRKKEGKMEKQDREMGRDRSRRVVCVGNVEDNGRGFIIVFGFRAFFFLSYCHITGFPSFSPHSTHAHGHSSFWLRYMREADRWAHSRKGITWVWLTNSLQSFISHLHIPSQINSWSISCQRKK